MKSFSSRRAGMMWCVERSESYPVYKTLYHGEDEGRAREVFAACYGVMRKTTYLILSCDDKPVHKVFFRKRIITVW
jgi:hypothetical protein